jgi:hypothetical protein
MLRKVAVIGAAVLAIQMVCTDVQAQGLGEFRYPGFNEIQIEDLPSITIRRPKAVKPVKQVRTARKHRVAAPVALARPARPSVETQPEAGAAVVPGSQPELSYQQERVRQIAQRHGDRDFLMVDKALGEIILFLDGEPIFSGSALTGASKADRLPANALSLNFSKLTAPDTKVTPAGRFTVRRSRDKEYGPLLDINEIRGKDWGIAIHQVYLGIPEERRAARLQSDNDEEKHITYGCINVLPETLRFLLSRLPENQATPLYILPQDEAKTTAFFTAGNF